MNTESVSENQLLVGFEQQQLANGLSHLDHIRLTWIYLNRCDVSLASTKITNGIKAYAESQGANDKFHLTVTLALVRLMAGRKKSLANPSWECFLHQNSDILKDFRAVLRQYYSDKVLWSKKAKTHFVEPDLQPLL